MPTFNSLNKSKSKVRTKFTHALLSDGKFKAMNNNLFADTIVNAATITHLGEHAIGSVFCVKYTTIETTLFYIGIKGSEFD